MEGFRFIRNIKLKNILSFGSEGIDLDLEPLNVLIGPNGSGKSNFIKAIQVLQNLNHDFWSTFRYGGGTDEWRWKGVSADIPSKIEVAANFEPNSPPLYYSLEFLLHPKRLTILSETLASVSNDSKELLYKLEDEIPNIYARSGSSAIRENFSRIKKSIPADKFKPQQTIMSQYRDYEQSPELAYLSDSFSATRFYLNWNMQKVREPQASTELGDYLEEDGSNLTSVLNNLYTNILEPDDLRKHLKDLNERIEDLGFSIVAGSVEIYLRERNGNRTFRIPASLLSDGTLRYLCLIAVLCNPNLPPLVCIEEPELGLHPDMLPAIAEMLIEASKRSQIIVTTHSDILVSALREVPEAVVACERRDTGTQLRRLDAKQLKEWLEDYSLGELWLRGELGGTRW